MKEFNFKVLKWEKLFIYGISYFLVFLSLSIFLAIHVNEFLAFIVFVMTFILITPFQKKVREFKEVTILMDDGGITLVTQNKAIKWEEIESYYFVNNRGLEEVRIKLKNRKRISIQWFDEANDALKCNDFKDSFIAYLKKNDPTVRSFFDKPIWKIVAYLVIASYIILPVVLIILGAKTIQVLAPVFGYIGTTLVWVISILSRKRS